MASGLLAGALPSVAAHRTVTRRPTPVGASCSIRHPLSIQIVALDPVRRGQVVRLRVSIQPERAIERGEVRLAHSGDAVVTGARRAALSRIDAGGSAAQDFAVRIPTTGSRTLLEFVVEAEGAQGSVRRGATFNLLPDGPAEQPRVTRTADGTAVSEVVARRLEP
jgi:hypothetical protein